MPIPGRRPHTLMALRWASKHLLAGDAALDGGRFVVMRRAAHRDLTALVGDRPAGGDLAARAVEMSVDGITSLAFDSVVLIDPARIVAESRPGANDLQVALIGPRNG